MERYGLRQATVAAHAQEICDYLGYGIFGDREQAFLKEFLEGEVLHLEQTSRLLARAEEYGVRVAMERNPGVLASFRGQLQLLNWATTPPLL